MEVDVLMAIVLTLDLFHLLLHQYHNVILVPVVQLAKSAKIINVLQLTLVLTVILTLIVEMFNNVYHIDVHIIFPQLQLQSQSPNLSLFQHVIHQMIAEPGKNVQVINVLLLILVIPVILIQIVVILKFVWVGNVLVLSTVTAVQIMIVITIKNVQIISVIQSISELIVIMLMTVVIHKSAKIENVLYINLPLLFNVTQIMTVVVIKIVKLVNV